ncbi:hypothetical protein PEL8287_01931 [Roseovarius litorisediminis]|uniref:Protoheme IX farnesyltransferase n=1 Tax=Roseovarius litorisediminis TaxID=1312363 RepID=A0A1Y5SGR3_9RHOB|nr:hypothetical protein [Roseovarius litorisediminis]SLN39256.1 hypothetical protein PEL8287_01931 [Roseovarius litorisediminis]
MTPEFRQTIVQGRINNYYEIMRTSIFTFTGLAAIIQLGPDGYSAPLTMLVVAVTAYAILAGGTALDDVINLAEDMDDDMAQSAYGKGVKARNIPMLKMISSGLMALIGVAELFAIFT